MVLKINGETRAVPPLTSVHDLLRFLGVGEGRIAVEVNHRIVRRKDWDATPLGDMDKVEIVQFVGGG